MALSVFKNFIRQDVAIDLGTANTLLYLKGEGIVLREPTVIATDDNDQVIAFGDRAKAYLGKAPSHIKVVRPLKSGTIRDLDSIALFIRKVIEISKKNRSFLSSRVIICVPSKLTQIEKKAVLDAAKAAGFKKIYLLEEAFAAAIGANLDISDRRPVMVVDIGGGTTEIAVISQKAYVFSDSRKIGGDDMDEALCKMLLKRYALKVGQVTAERLKWDIGCLTVKEADGFIPARIAGQNVKEQCPDTIWVDPNIVLKALVPVAKEIAYCLKEVINSLDKSTKDFVIKDGIVLTGGVSLLRGISEFFEDELGIQVAISQNPLEDVVLGAGKVLSRFKEYKKIFVN